MMPAIVWKGAAPGAFAIRRLVRRIIVHWWDDPAIAASWELERVDRTFGAPAAKTSAHFAVEDELVHQYVSVANIAFHAGNWDYNVESVGIELHPALSNATYRTSARLIAALCVEFGIRPHREGPQAGWTLLGHSEVPHPKIPGQFVATRCPGLAEGGWNPDRHLRLIRDGLADLLAM